jgi:Arc/MetJ-type ribon-helix-helix transcriptional regulator
MTKERITVSVDPELAAAAASAVEEGRAESVSAWIGEAMREKAARDRRLAALAEAVAAHEAEHGVIGDDEIVAQARADRDAAAASRARRRKRGAA